MSVSCHMPNKVRVGRSAFFLFFFDGKDFVDKIEGKSGLQFFCGKNSVFRVIFVKKKLKKIC